MGCAGDLKSPSLPRISAFFRKHGRILRCVTKVVCTRTLVDSSSQSYVGSGTRLRPTSPTSVNDHKHHRRFVIFLLEGAERLQAQTPPLTFMALLFCFPSATRKHVLCKCTTGQSCTTAFVDSVEAIDCADESFAVVVASLSSSSIVIGGTQLQLRIVVPVLAE